MLTLKGGIEKNMKITQRKTKSTFFTELWVLLKHKSP